MRNMKSLILAGASVLSLTLVGAGLMSMKADRPIAAEAATAQTMQRVYVCVQGWRTDGSFLCFSGPDLTDQVAMSLIAADYWGGLWYASIPKAAVACQVLQWDGSSKNSDWSDNIDISANPSVSNWFLIGNWVSDFANRTVTAETSLGMSEAQLVSTLKTIDTCSSDYATGYNNYLQLNTLVLPSTATEIKASATAFVDPHTKDGDPTTYTVSVADQASAPGALFHSTVSSDNSALFWTVAIAAAGAIAVAGFFIVKKRGV